MKKVPDPAGQKSTDPTGSGRKSTRPLRITAKKRHPKEESKNIFTSPGNGNGKTARTHQHICMLAATPGVQGFHNEGGD